MFAGVKGFFKSVSAVATDAYFNLVTLLLPGNGTNGANNNAFIDSSSNNFTITRNGNTTQGTFSPFSQTGWGNYFGGDGYLDAGSNAAFSMGSGNYTFECWVYVTNTSGLKNLFCSDTSASGNIDFYIDYGASNTKLEVRGGANICTFAYTPPANTWVHLAFVRSGTGTNQTVLYANGTSVGTGTDATNWTGTGPMRIGGIASLAYMTGYISNARITKGGALYTSNFTPSTTPLTTTVSAGTVSLLTCQSNRFVDNSTNAFAITVTGTPSVQAFSPFAPTAAYSASTNGGSGYFDGTGDFLSAPDNVAFTMGSGNFTIEAWAYKPATGRAYILGQSDGVNLAETSFAIQVNASNKLVSAVAISSTEYTATSTADFPLNQWVHVAMVRNGGTLSQYINGTLDGQNATLSTGSVNDSTIAVGIGALGTLATFRWTGYIAGVKIVKGTASAPSSVPTSPPVDSSGTSLLLNFTNAGITDATAKNDLETVGNAQISTTQSKFGGSSMYFDGTGDWLFARYNQDLELGSGDFTIECWVYFSTLPSNAAAAIASYGDTDGTPRWIFYYDSRTGSANGLRFTVVNGSGTSIVLVEGGGTSGWAANTWYHVAITRSGSSWRLFRDGTQTGSTLTDTDAIPAASNNGLYIGSENGSIPLTGYIDDFRITKGYARYTANFSAPTAAFPVQ